MLRTSKLLEKLGGTRNYKGNPVEKIKIAAEYIANNLEGNENDEKALNELVFVLKKNISETLLHQAEENNFKIHDKNLVAPMQNVNVSKANQTLSMFMLAPETMLKKMVDEQIKEVPNDKNVKSLDSDDSIAEEEEEVIKSNPIQNNDIDPDDIEVDESKEPEFRKAQMIKYNNQKYQEVSNLLNNKDTSYEIFERENFQVLNDKYNIAEKMMDRPVDNPVEEIVSHCKGGFFERMFNTTSREYRNFETVFQQRMNGQASRERLNEAAIEYLHHKFPTYPGKEITEKDIEKLSSTSRNRVNLCLETLKATNKSTNYEKKLTKIEDTSRSIIKDKGLTNTFEQLRIENGNKNLQAANEIDNNQLNFQNNLERDVDNDLDKNLNINEIIDKGIEEIKIDDLDNSMQQ